MKNNITTLTPEQLSAIDALDAKPIKGDNSHLKAKYLGTRKDIIESGVNGTIKLINVEPSMWLFTAGDGEGYRIPEPADGIDSVFEIEFKRKEAKGE